MESTNIDMTKWLEMKNINIPYNNKLTVSNLDLTLYQGQNTVILGCNGSGKSTLVKTIAKIKYPLFQKDSYINILGKYNFNIWSLRAEIGFLFTEIDQRIKRNIKTIEVILSAFQSTFGLLNPQCIEKGQILKTNEIMEKLGITYGNQKYLDLSDGQKRKVLIARALVHGPKILVLDEPTSMLDVKSTFEVLDILSNLAKEGITLLYVTNTIETIINEVERVIFLKDGRIIKDGNISNVLNSVNLTKLYDYPINLFRSEKYWHLSPS